MHRRVAFTKTCSPSLQPAGLSPSLSPPSSLPPPGQPAAPDLLTPVILLIDAAEAAKTSRHGVFMPDSSKEGETSGAEPPGPFNKESLKELLMRGGKNPF